jgi:hypothetical protein
LFYLDIYNTVNNVSFIKGALFHLIVPSCGDEISVYNSKDNRQTTIILGLEIFK